MKNCELKIITKSLNYDDEAVVENYLRLKYDYNVKKKVFESNLCNLDKNNYLRLAVSRLEYEFTKEELNAFSGEMARRGLSMC